MSVLIDPEDAWRSSIEGEAPFAIAGEKLCAMARAREKLDSRVHWIAITVATALAGVFAWNALTVPQTQVRLGQGWLAALLCVFVWTSNLRGRRGKRLYPESGVETCVAFLQRTLAAQREGYLTLRRNMILIVPAILLSWSGRDPARTSVWLFAVVAVALVLSWIGFGLAAAKRTREIAGLTRLQ
jgi:hypothetical protein